MRIIILVAFLVFSFSVASGQNPEWINYTSGKNVLSLAVEGDFVWVGTWGGLVRVNRITGETTFYNKANSGLPDNSVRAIAIDNVGNKWVGTVRGLAKFDGVNWTVYNTSNSGLPYNWVNAIAIDNAGNKWIGTNGGGLAKFDGVNWTVYNTSNSGLPSNYVYAIAIDNAGNKWIGTLGGGVAKFDGVNWTIYNESNSGLPSNYVYAIAIDNAGNKWIGTVPYWNGQQYVGGGLAKFDGQRWTVHNTSNSGLPSNSVYAIAMDNEGNKWIGTHGGLVKFDGVSWTVYNPSNSGLPSWDVTAIAIDNAGNKWIGTDGGGVAKFDGVNWTIYNESNSGLPSDYVWAIAIDNAGNKWIGTNGGGLAVYREGGVILDVERENSVEIPTKFILYQNYPNPFNPETVIEFDLPEKVNVKLVVYDVLGREVGVLVDKELGAGRYKVKFDGRDLSSGIYFYELRAGRFREVRKMVLVK